MFHVRLELVKVTGICLTSLESASDYNRISQRGRILKCLNIEIIDFPQKGIG
jgi:hypothetical protein